MTRHDGAKSAPIPTKPSLTVRDLSAHYGVCANTILSWIRDGELCAINVVRKPGGKKPRWRITAEALAAFEASRMTSAPVPAVQGRKRAPDVIEFYR
jgi:hypothetical protein